MPWNICHVWQTEEEGLLEESSGFQGLLKQDLPVCRIMIVSRHVDLLCWEKHLVSIASNRRVNEFQITPTNNVSEYVHAIFIIFNHHWNHGFLKSPDPQYLASILKTSNSLQAFTFLQLVLPFGHHEPLVTASIVILKASSKQVLWTVYDQ